MFVCVRVCVCMHLQWRIRRGVALGTRPLRSKFFLFMSFSAITFSNNRLVYPNRWGWRPLWEMLDPSQICCYDTPSPPPLTPSPLPSTGSRAWSIRNTCSHVMCRYAVCVVWSACRVLVVSVNWWSGGGGQSAPPPTTDQNSIKRGFPPKIQQKYKDGALCDKNPGSTTDVVRAVWSLRRILRKKFKGRIQDSPL